MDIKDIINLPLNKLKNYGKILADDYRRLTNNNVCLSCSGDVNKMLLYLKKYYNMTNFELKRPSVIYRIEKGSPTTISNNVMTDELAIMFISINPERINLFSKYPENWKDLINPEEVETKEDDCKCVGKELAEMDCDDCKREHLEGMKMKEIKEAFPDIETPFGMKKADLIEAVLKSL